MKKKVFLAVIIPLALCGAAWFGHDWYTVGRFVEKTDDAYVGGDITVIAPKVPGLIEGIAVEDNQFVHAGDLLLCLDDRDYRTALAKSEAGIAEQRAALVELAATRKLQEAVVAEQEAAVTVTDADIELTNNQNDRSRKLLELSAGSRRDYEKADADSKQAVAQGLEAHAALEAARLQLVVLDARPAQIEAALQKATAERDMARLNLEYARLRAPVDGMVGNRSAQAGSYAPVGTQLISLVPATGLWIDANFKESQIARMRPGMEVIIEADAQPDKVFHGHITSLSPATGARFSVLPPENATGNFTKIVQRVPVRIALDGEAAILGELRPGLSVTVKVNVNATSKP